VSVLNLLQRWLISLVLINENSCARPVYEQNKNNIRKHAWRDVNVSIWSKGVSQTATAICRSPYCWLRFFREWSTRHDRLVDYSHAEVTIRPDGCRQETRSQVTGLAQEITQTGRTQTHNREQCVHLRLCGRIGKTCFFLFFFVWTQGYGVHANVKAHDVHANVYAWTQLAVYVWTKTYDVHASVFMTLVLSLFLHRSQILDLILQKAAFQCYRKRRRTKGRRTNYKNTAICKRSNVIWVTWFWFLLSVGLQKRGVAVDAAPRS